LWQITVGAIAVVKLEDGYIAVDVPGESKFFLNAINQAALKEWLNALNDVIKLNKVQFDSLGLPCYTSSRLLTHQSSPASVIEPLQEVAVTPQYQYSPYHYHTMAQAQAQAHAQAQAITQSPPPSAMYGHSGPVATTASGPSGSVIPVPPVPTHIQSLRESQKSSGSGLRLSGSGTADFVSVTEPTASSPASGSPASDARRSSVKPLPAVPAASKTTPGPSRTFIPRSCACVRACVLPADHPNATHRAVGWTGRHVSTHARLAKRPEGVGRDDEAQKGGGAAAASQHRAHAKARTSPEGRQLR
jgi:hypothetical protein